MAVLERDKPVFWKNCYFLITIFHLHFEKNLKQITVYNKHIFKHILFLKSILYPCFCQKTIDIATAMGEGGHSLKLR